MASRPMSRENDHGQRKLNIWTGDIIGFVEATQHDANNHGATLTRYVYATNDSNIFIWVKSVALKKSFREALSLRLILEEGEAVIIKPNIPPRSSTPAKKYNIKDNQWPSN